MSYTATGEGYVVRDDGAKIPIVDSEEFPNTNPDYLAYKQWLAAGNTLLPAPPLTAEEQKLKDQARYKRRAEVRAELISWMAADNMSRVRAGIWSVPDLVNLMADPAITRANAFMQTLSYELVADEILQAANPLLTPEIKNSWVSKLMEHFYL